jgi:hypothetical protein
MGPDGGRWRRVFFVAATVLSLALLAGCASSEVDSGGQPSAPTSVRIERTYALLNASPFQMTGDAATASTLYGALQALSPDSGQTACPGDTAVHYTIAIERGTSEILKATAIYGGCRVVVMNGSSFSGTGSAGKAFWAALFEAVGPDGQPGTGSDSQSGSAS